MSRAKKTAYEQREIQATKEKELEKLKIEVIDGNKQKRTLRNRVQRYAIFKNFFEQVRKFQISILLSFS
jgi:hypothetical protein